MNRSLFFFFLSGFHSRQNRSTLYLFIFSDPQFVYCCCCRWCVSGAQTHCRCVTDPRTQHKTYVEWSSSSLLLLYKHWQQQKSRSKTVGFVHCFMTGRLEDSRVIKWAWLGLSATTYPPLRISGALEIFQVFISSPVKIQTGTPAYTSVSVVSINYLFVFSS